MYINSFPRYTGTPVLISWGRHWSAFMEGVCVMDPQLRMVSTMTCSLMDRSELMFFFSVYVATLFYVISFFQIIP